MDDSSQNTPHGDMDTAPAANGDGLFQVAGLVECVDGSTLLLSTLSVCCLLSALCCLLSAVAMQRWMGEVVGTQRKEEIGRKETK